MLMKSLCSFLCASALLASAPAWAEGLVGDPERGRLLAEEACILCHTVAPGDRTYTLIGAPPFQAVADDPAVTNVSLRVFLQTPHETMPDLVLTAPETDDIVAYILGMK